MKTLICHCSQCKTARKRIRKRNRSQTRQVRAYRHKVKRLLKQFCYDDLPLKTPVDYYA